MNEKVLGCLSWGLSRSWSLCSVEPESVRSKHISLLLHAHPNQAYLFMLIKVKDSLRIKRPQVRILPSAPQTAHVLRSVGGFSFCKVLFGKLPLRDLCQMGRGAGVLLCIYRFFFRSSDQLSQILSQQHLYKAMEEAVAAGKLRAIGISNFSAAQIEEIMAVATIKPAVQQVETHLYNQQGAMMEYISNYGTVLESWFPLGGRGNAHTFLELPEVQEIASAHGKLPVQVIIRWHLQSGHVCIPGSINETHIQENANVFDFELTADEMAKLNALNRNAPYFQGMGGNEEENRAIIEAMVERWGLNQGE